MSAHKNAMHYLVLGWLSTNGLDDAAENYQAGVDALMAPELDSNPEPGPAVLHTEGPRR